MKSMTKLNLFISIILINACVPTEKKTGPATIPTAPVSKSVDHLISTSTALTANGANLQNSKSPIGGNLGAVTYYSDDWVFVDQIVKGKPWIPGTRTGDDCAADYSAPENWDQVRNAARPWLNAKGWPVFVPDSSCVLFSTMLHTAGRYPKGKYQLLWDGEGKLSGNGGVGIVSSTEGGEAYFKVTDPKLPYLFLSLLKTNPANPIRNIRLIMPGGVCGTSETKLDYARYCDPNTPCDSGSRCFSFKNNYFNRFTDDPSLMNNGKVVFHPTTLASMQKYRVIRFMDWMGTNHTDVASWNHRATLDYVTATTAKGVQYEYAIALANVLGADAWFNMPHKSNDTYNSKFASLVKETLNPKLKAYVEYSNEVWNWIFPQATYALQKGVEQKLDSDQYKAATAFYSKRSVEIFRIWSGVFGTEAPSRLVRVLAGQAANSSNGIQIMDYNNAKAETDAYAIAPYFGGELGTQASTQQMTSDQLFKALTTKSLPEAVGWIKTNAANTSSRGLRLIAYEGGQHLVGIGGLENNQAITNLFINANRDPRMGQLYTTYLTAWKKNGGHEFVNFSHMGEFSKWGSWSLLEDQLQTTSPKYDAVQNFITAHPCWWKGCERP